MRYFLTIDVERAGRRLVGSSRFIGPRARPSAACLRAAQVVLSTLGLAEVVMLRLKISMKINFPIKINSDKKIRMECFFLILIE